jgi:hypothetical protein
MAERDEPACLVVRAAASFDSDQARLQAREERRHLVSLELLAKHCTPVLINTVNLKDVLGEVQTNRRDLSGPLTPRRQL